MTQVLNVVAIMKAAPGKEAQLKTLLAAALPKFQAEPGCLSYALLADLEHSGQFVSYEAWKDEDALQQHMKAPALTEAMPVLKTILAEPMQQIRLNAFTGSTV